MRRKPVRQIPVCLTELYTDGTVQSSIAVLTSHRPLCSVMGAAGRGFTPAPNCVAISPRKVSDAV